MFRFENPICLYGLILVLILAIIRFVTSRSQKKRLRLFGNQELLKELMPDISRIRPTVKFVLLEMALALLFVMLARPQFGTHISHEKRTGIETVIAMDISNSMRAEDVSPSRLERAKMMIENLVDHFVNDKIGLIVFAGDAFVQLPITSDYVSAKMFLGNIDPSMIQNQGTDIAAAINMAMHSFTQQENVGKAIIVITDGEDHEGGALEAAKAAREKGMRVYVLGIGSINGAPIPVSKSGDYMRDGSGNTVMSALNEQMCREIAQAGGGAYIHVENNSNAQRQLDEELDKLEKKESNSTIYSDYDEQFQAVGVIVMLLLILEVIILDCKNPYLNRMSLFKSKKIVTVFLLLLAISVQAQTDRQYLRQGNKHFQQNDYEHAETSYTKAIEKNGKNPQAHYNLGTALMAQKKDSVALKMFEKAAMTETNPLRKSQSYHNMGVIHQRNGRIEDAMQAYMQTLRLNPNDDEARYNFELCKHYPKKNNDQQQQQQQQQEKKEEKKEDKKQQQQQQQQQMSKENAEQLLNAAMQQEKRTQEKMKEAQQQPQRRRLEKNW